MESSTPANPDDGLGDLDLELDEDIDLAEEIHDLGMEHQYDPGWASHSNRICGVHDEAGAAKERREQNSNAKVAKCLIFNRLYIILVVFISRNEIITRLIRCKSTIHKYFLQSQSAIFYSLHPGEKAVCFVYWELHLSKRAMMKNLNSSTALWKLISCCICIIVKDMAQVLGILHPGRGRPHITRGVDCLVASPVGASTRRSSAQPTLLT